ncbi:hypothetical protein [Candidatus Rickettsiella viridis]|nr:hypothetical protein [Candidatus Rickettsiella viridis]
MKSLINISASTGELQDHFDLLSCFLNSASMVRGMACDGITRNNSIGSPMPEFWNQHFITVFYLFRHALELAVKALIKEVTGHDVVGHNIQKMWEENIPNYQNVIPEQINKTFTVLAKYHLLNDAQLFRYHADKGGVKLKDMPLIHSDDFDTISGAAWAIRQLVLECIHIKKDLPI